MPEPVTTTAALIGIFKSLRAGIRTLRQGQLSDQHKQAVEEVSDLLTDAQDRLSDLQTESIELREKNSELKRQLTEADAWTKMFSEYHLTTTDGGAVVYQKSWNERQDRTIIVGKSGGDPDHKHHYVCPSCVSKRELQILQDERNSKGTFKCPSCGAVFPINVRTSRNNPRTIMRG